MPLFIGADLGTSALKLILTDEMGHIYREAKREYPLSMPKEGWSEQQPELWWNAFVAGIIELTEEINSEEVKGICVAGQMHGLVALDSKDRVIRPAILWNDGRTGKQVRYLNEVIGKKPLTQMTGNIAFAGFTAPKLLWMREEEPDLFSCIHKIMLPKDYLVYQMCGIHSCDYSDASGMLLLDVENKGWADQMLEICGISAEQLPKLYESFDVVGTLRAQVAEELQLSKDVLVMSGAGDNAAAAIGTGAVGNGDCNISLGTSGTVFVASDTFKVDSHNALHAFAHADGRYHLMGCMLSAASCNKWFYNDILHTDRYDEEQSVIDPNRLGYNPVFFLPYLMGERSPINDTFARGAFVGLSMDTSRQQFGQAVLEGVSFALRDICDIVRSLDIPLTSATLCGGGARSKLWRTILAAVLGISLKIPAVDEGPSFGAAMLAMTGCGYYRDIDQCVETLIRSGETIEPDKELMALYDSRYKVFRDIYPSLKNVFPRMGTGD